MKKLFALTIAFLLTPLLSFAQNNFHFSLAPRASFTWGELTELLYNNDGTLVSQLDWEQKALFNLGLETKLSFNNCILSAAFDYSAPFGTSYMYDSDWEDGEKYSFTKHPIINTQNYNTELSFAYNIQATRRISVLPELQLNYIYSSFEAANGSGTRYGRDIKVYGVDYKRHSLFVFTGLSVGAELGEKILLKTSFLTAPFLYQYSSDYHHGVKHPFSSRDVQTAFFSKYTFDLSTEFLITNPISLELFTGFLFGFPDKGAIYSDYFGSWAHITEQKSGAAINYVKSGLSIKFTF